jgi:SH3 domain-containing YSC84-like protein 1
MTLLSATPVAPVALTAAMRPSLRRALTLCIGVVALALSLGLLGGCEQSMITRSNEAASVLRDFQLSDTKIPDSAFASAQAVAILRESEAGVVVGAGGGKGVMLQRTAKGWSAPIALDSSTGSFGAQIGGKGRDVVMLFRSATEIDKVLREDGYSLADASAAAGPMTGAAGENDNPVQTYVRVAGLFAGARIGGVKFTINDKVNNETYGLRWTAEEILDGKVERPLGTAELYRLLPAASGASAGR